MAGVALAHGGRRDAANLALLALAIGLLSARTALGAGQDVSWPAVGLGLPGLALLPRWWRPGPDRPGRPGGAGGAAPSQGAPEQAGAP